MCGLAFIYFPILSNFLQTTPILTDEKDFFFLVHIKEDVALIIYLHDYRASQQVGKRRYTLPLTWKLSQPNVDAAASLPGKLAQKASNIFVYPWSFGFSGYNI